MLESNGRAPLSIKRTHISIVPTALPQKPRRRLMANVNHLPIFFSSNHRRGGKVKSAKPHPNQIPISAPVPPPTRFATGPTYQAWDMPIIAPAHPIKKEANAAKPIGRYFWSSHFVQSKPFVRRKIKCSHSIIVAQITIQYPINARKFWKIWKRWSRPAMAQTK